MKSPAAFALLLRPGTTSFGLTTVGTFSVTTQGPGTVAFPALTSITGAGSFDGPATLSAPLLKTVTMFKIGNQSPAGGLNLPALTSADELDIVQSTITTLDLPALVSSHSMLIGGLGICTGGNSQLTTLHLPLLTTVAGITFGGDPVLPLCRAQALAAQISPPASVTYGCTLAAGPCP